MLAFIQAIIFRASDVYRFFKKTKYFKRVLLKSIILLSHVTQFNIDFDVDQYRNFEKMSP